MVTAAKPSSAASRLAFLDHAGRRGVRIEPAAVAKAAASPPPVLRFRHLGTSKPRHPADYRLAWLVLTVRRLPPLGCRPRRRGGGRSETTGWEMIA